MHVTTAVGMARQATADGHNFSGHARPCHHVVPVRDRLTLTPRAYARVTYVALAALGLIVLTGAGVRLTGSGLGCPNWPKCGASYIAPLETHAVIEYGNRLLSGLVGLVVMAAGLLAWRRRPFRRDLAVLGVLPALGVLGQGVLGGLTVEFGLKPGFVMAHFGLSMLLLVAAFALAWRATYERGERPRATDAVSVWAGRALLGFGAVVIFVGTVATAAGPHAGGSGTDDVVDRLMFKGTETLLWTIRSHARLAGALGVAAVAVWFLLRSRGADRQTRRAVTVLAFSLAAQGVTGTIQYHLLNLPPEVVWVHVVGASVAWLSLLWAVAATGRLRAKPSASPVLTGEQAVKTEPSRPGVASGADAAYERELTASRRDPGRGT